MSGATPLTRPHPLNLPPRPPMPPGVPGLRLMLPIAAALTVAAVWISAGVQRDAATRAADRIQSTEELLIAMLDQETALRGYVVARDPQFLEPYTRGRATYVRAHADLAARQLGPGTRALLAESDRLAREWSSDAGAVLRRLRATGDFTLDRSGVLRRKRAMDAYRELNRQLQDAVERDRAQGQRDAAVASAAIVGGLLVLLTGGLVLFAARRERVERDHAQVERRHVDRQAEFAEMLAVVRDEAEAHGVLRRHLVRGRRGRTAAVLTANNSENRLVCSAADEGCQIAERVGDGVTVPQDCVAVRMGRTHEERDDSDALLRCTLCAGTAPALKCSPLLVQGKVIGSVLVGQDAPFEEHDVRGIRESVAQAAPVVGNVRAIAMAESRAATDALTGLPNRRASAESLKRMVALAGRTLQPLAAIAIDVDHFKAINDTYGHDKGDEVLAAVAATLRATLRESDFVARIGGEEFLVLAPGADVDGAGVLAANLRAAVGRVAVTGLTSRVTASFGIAVYPEHATSAEQLTRLADRALYAAKEGGRDRFEIVSVSSGTAA